MTLLETPRLLVQTWESDDWLEFRPISTDPEVMRYIGPGQIWSDEQIRGFVSRQIERAGSQEFLLWKLTEKESGQLIGFCGLQHLGEAGEVEIGWWLARDRWGRGLATEAAQAVLHHALENLSLDRVVAIAQPENIASINIMRKLGMNFERRCSHGDLGKPNPEIELVFYAIDN